MIESAKYIPYVVQTTTGKQFPICLLPVDLSNLMRNRKLIINNYIQKERKRRKWQKIFYSNRSIDHYKRAYFSTIKV